MESQTMNAQAEWLNLDGVCQVLKVTRHQASRMLKKANVTTRQLPGMRRQVCRADLERLARDAIRPAQAAV